MASLGFFQMFAFFLSASFLIYPISAANLTSALFAFGDGLFDLGNNAYLDSSSQFNIYPYGISNDVGATGRPSDGLLVVDFIADKSGLHQRVRPYLANVTAEWYHGASFATAGTTVNSDDDDYTLAKQLIDFGHLRNNLMSTFGYSETIKLLSNSIYLFSFGSQDYLNLGSSVDAATLAATIDKVIEAYVDTILRIYELGGRKFGFQNIGPLRQMPYFKNLYNTSSCDTDYKPVAQWHNIRLEDKLQQLATCQQDGSIWLQGFQYSYFDYYSVVTNLTNSFENGTDACCGSGEYNGEMSCAIGDENIDYNLCSDRSQYVWFDGVHPTQAANEIIAEQFWSGTTNMVRPSNLKELLESTTSTITPKKRSRFSASV